MNCTLLHTVDPAINWEYLSLVSQSRHPVRQTVITDWETFDEGIRREPETTRGRRGVLDWGLERLLWGGDISVDPKGKGEANEFRIWRKSILGERNMCKGPEVGKTWVEGSVRTWRAQGVRDEVAGGRAKSGRVCFFQVRSFWGIWGEEIQDSPHCSM